MSAKDERDALPLHRLPKEFSPYNLKRWANAMYRPGPLRDSLLCYAETWEADKAALSAQPAPDISDEQIDAVFNDFAGTNDFGAPYLRSYKEGFRSIARAVLALAAPPATQKEPKP